MKTSIILNAAFRGNTDAQSVKNHAEAYIAVSNPWKQITCNEQEIFYYSQMIVTLRTTLSQKKRLNRNATRYLSCNLR